MNHIAKHEPGRTMVTGSAGFLGRALVRTLLQRGDSVAAFDLLETRVRRATDIRGDLGSRSSVVNAVRSSAPDRIFHCGGVLAAAAEADPEGGLRVNAEGMFNLLEAARLAGVAQVVFLSSVSTYGVGTAVPVADDAPQRPTTIYGITKVHGELLGEYYARRYGIDFRGLRFPSIVGPGRPPGGGSAYTSQMIELAAKGRPVVVPVHESTVMPILFIDDAVRALIELSEAKGPLPRRLYNIAGLSPSAGDLAAELNRLFPGLSVEFRPDDAIQAAVDSWPDAMAEGAARADWGWTGVGDLGDMVRRFVAATLAAEETPAAPT